MNLLRFLWIFVLLAWTDAMKQGDPGVCSVKARTRKINPKINCHHVKDMENVEREQLDVLICCELYEYNSSDDSCDPVCEHECIGGRCVAPNVCICEPPLFLNTATTPYNCVLPVCDNPCVNGVCTANNQCTCNDGYEMQADNFTCIAQCTNCTNGDCVYPNVCLCHKGYYALNNNPCTPYCENDCTNGFCSSPNVCTCNRGYESLDNTCKPICEKSCVNATCIAPNTCGVILIKVVS